MVVRFSGLTVPDAVGAPPPVWLVGAPPVTAGGVVVGGVVVAPRASELIMPIAMAVENHLSVDQLAHTITIYPSVSGSIAEAALQLMQHDLDLD